MTEPPPPPPPRSPDYAPHEVTQDPPFEGHDNDPISHPPDEGFDDWSPADTARIVTMSMCDDDRLKSCIILYTRCIPLSSMQFIVFSIPCIQITSQ